MIQGPCPLLAIANLLLVCGKLSLHPDLAWICNSELTTFVTDYVLASKPKVCAPLLIDVLLPCMQSRASIWLCDTIWTAVFFFCLTDAQLSTAEEKLNYEQNVHDAVAMMPSVRSFAAVLSELLRRVFFFSFLLYFALIWLKLHRGLDVNVKFVGYAFCAVMIVLFHCARTATQKSCFALNIGNLTRQLDCNTNIL